jgi:hypothetical protein
MPAFDLRQAQGGTAVGDHVIQHLIPKSDADADNPRYRVKSIVDSQERIVPQNDLTLSERSFSRKLSVAR